MLLHDSFINIWILKVSAMACMGIKKWELYSKFLYLKIGSVTSLSDTDYFDVIHTPSIVPKIASRLDPIEKW